MESGVDRESKLNALLERMTKIMYILSKILDRHEADTDIDYLEQPMLSPNQTQTQPLQDIYNKKNMYDEQDYSENNEEYCQESPESLHLSCIMLLRDLYDQTAIAKSEQCFEETISLLGNTEPEIEENPQGLPEHTSKDPLREAQEDIQPQNQPTQEKED